MADWTRSEYTAHRVEYTVPCNGLWGAAWADVQKAMRAAGAEYRQANRIAEAAMVPDDALRVFPGDDEIVIRFEVKESGRG